MTKEKFLAALAALIEAVQDSASKEEYLSCLSEIEALVVDTIVDLDADK